jgi:glycosyltransferase involved in cell wall biosynthesis
MIVSVVITTKNEEEHIGSCLESIRNQSYPQEKIEIIVVDNNSSDKTKEISGRYSEKVYNFGPERSSQRNYGVKQANGKYFLYLDADMILSGNIISECVNKCEQEGCIALYIPERVIGKGFWITVRDFERSFYNATVIDCVRFIRRDKFLEIGGFDENLTGPEDWDLDRRIREVGEVNIINSPISHNEGDFNLKKYINKKTYYARSFNKYIQKWGRNDPIIKKQLGLGYRFFGVFLENGKWVRLIHNFPLAIGIYILRTLIGIIYLKQMICNRRV